MDYVTLRYYGAYEDRFRRTNQWPKKSPYGLPAMDKFSPTEVCQTFKAVCVNLGLNQCVKAPPEFRAPWTRKFFYTDPGRAVFDPPHETEPGSYMIITDVDPKYETNQHTHEPRQLFSGCDAGCRKCAEGTGTALHPVLLPSMCIATEQGSVFALMYNHNSSHYPSVQTDFNCVESLADFYGDLEAANSLRELITGVVVGGLAVILACIVMVMICVFKKRRAAAEEELMRALRQGQAQFNAGAGSLVAQAQIEATFPITSIATDPAPTCVVCLGDITPDQPARQLQCSHAFHAECIMSWWLHRPRRVIQCPMCQQQQTVSMNSSTSAPGEVASASPVVLGAAEQNALAQASSAAPAAETHNVQV